LLQVPVVARFETSSVVMFQVEVFWVVTPCSVVVGYQRFRGPHRVTTQISTWKYRWLKNKNI